MSSTSQKMRNFVAEPIRDKAVDELPGIGPKYGKMLSEKGFDLAYVVLGQFLILKKEEDLFTMWFAETVEAKNCSHHAKQCFQGLKEWSDNFI